MNIRLFILERYVPGWLHRRLLRDLTLLTADALRVDAPTFGRVPRHEATREFGVFTREAVERVLAHDQPAAEAIRERLHARAHAEGRNVRRLLGITTRADALRAVRVLYREIGIELDLASDARELVVRACAFRRMYSPTVCAFIAALDAGFVCGLTGDAMLTFTERMTEGAPVCRATLIPATDASRGAQP